jgi:hypothetical protein
MRRHLKRLVDFRLNGPVRAASSPAIEMRTGLQMKTEHITDERLRGYIDGTVELTDQEQEHMLRCSFCDDRFRFFLTSNGESKAS